MTVLQVFLIFVLRYMRVCTHTLGYRDNVFLKDAKLLSISSWFCCSSG